MKSSATKRLWLALAAVVAGVLLWHGLRAVDGERVAFLTVAGSYANPPLFLTGNGTHEMPWSLRVKAPVAAIDEAKAPVFVPVADTDAARDVFMTSPPSAVDLKVVLDNLRRLGGRDAAIAYVMEWPEINAVTYQALENALNGFDLVVQAAPLKRHTLGEPMPPAFVRAALPRDAVAGDITKLPLMNRRVNPDAVLAGDKALAGFSTLDDVEFEGRVPLLARWQDDQRVVLAFPVLAVMARHGLPMDGVRVRLGEALELGARGPRVAIDEAGCLVLPAVPVRPRCEVPAEELASGEPGIFPSDPGLIVLCDRRAEVSAATKRFTADLAPVMAVIETSGGMGSAQAYPRLPRTVEILLGAVVALVAWWAAGLKGGRRWSVLGYGVMLVVAFQWLGVGMARVWLPGMPVLCGLLVFALLLRLRLDRVRVTAPGAFVSPPPPARPAFRTVTIWRDPGSAPPARKRITKSGAKSTPKPAADDAAPETSPPARKTARRRKSPPPES